MVTEEGKGDEEAKRDASDKSVFMSRVLKWASGRVGETEHRRLPPRRRGGRCDRIASFFLE